MASRRSTKFVCSRCLGNGRAFFSTSGRARQQPLSHNLPPVPPASGYARLTNRSLIAIGGVDSTSFLQGMVTQNMLMGKEPVSAARRTGSYSAFLNSQGRVLHDVFIYPMTTKDGTAEDPLWLIEVDKAEVKNLMKHLKKHKLRAKLTMRALEDGERSVWAAWNEGAADSTRWAAYNLDSDFPSQFSPTSLVAGCIDTRAPGFGSRLLTPGDGDLLTHLPDSPKFAGSEVDLQTYTLRRILHGVAEGQAEITREFALPMECNMDLTRAIDFRKGCYVGQELTIRTHHTGVVRKRILPVQLYHEGNQPDSSSETPVYDPQTAISLPQDGTRANISKTGARKGRSAGKFITGIGNVGLGICRLEMMTDISLTGESSQYEPSQEFKVWDGEAQQSADGQDVRIKAFVPPWLREHILAGIARRAPTPGPSEGLEGLRARDMVEQLEEEEAEAEERRQG